MDTTLIYDIVGIGAGPFNLGLAALASGIPELNCCFIDKATEFNWHPGMMLPTAKMQVPFYADLVTLADPTSPFTYLNYLKSTGRLFKFAINETHFPYRSEFNDYCRWVAAQLPSIHFGYACTQIHYDEDSKLYTMHVTGNNDSLKSLQARNIVVGIGSSPALPSCVTGIDHPQVFHSSEYLNKKTATLRQKRITIVGSGQSAAEIFLDLLQYNIESLSWFTRSERFHPMEYSKLTLEMSSPDYINYFYSLDARTKKKLLAGQQHLFRGINASLIEAIYDQLYLMDLQNVPPPEISTGCELRSIATTDESITLNFKHLATQTNFSREIGAVILATGYRNTPPNFLEPIEDFIDFQNIHHNYSIDNNNSLFVQNADLHTHGFNSADLGLGPYRNAVILNTILQKDYFKILTRSNVFQQFIPKQ